MNWIKSDDTTDVKELEYHDICGDLSMSDLLITILLIRPLFIWKTPLTVGRAVGRSFINVF